MVPRDSGRRPQLVNPYDTTDTAVGTASLGIAAGAVLAGTAGLVVLASGSASADPVFDDDAEYGVGPSSASFTFDETPQPDLFGNDGLYAGSAPDAVTFEVAAADPLPAPVYPASEPPVSESPSTPVAANVVTPIASPEPVPAMAAAVPADPGEMTFGVTEVPATEILGPDRTPDGAGAFEIGPAPQPDPAVPTLPDRGNESAPPSEPAPPPSAPVRAPGVLVASADLEGLGLDMAPPPTGAGAVGVSNGPVPVAAEPAGSAPPVTFGVTPAADILGPDPAPTGQGAFSPSPVLDEPPAVVEQPAGPTFGVTPSPIPDLVPGATPPEEPPAPAPNGEPVNFGTTPMSPEIMQGLEMTTDDLSFGVADPSTAAAITTGGPGVPGGAFSRDPRLAYPVNASPDRPAPPGQPARPGQPASPGGSTAVPGGAPQAPGSTPDRTSGGTPPRPGDGSGTALPPAGDRTTPPAPGGGQPPAAGDTPGQGRTILGTPVLDKNWYAPAYGLTGVPLYALLNAKTIQLDNPGTPFGRAALAGGPALVGGFTRDLLLANKATLSDDPFLNYLYTAGGASLLSIGTQELGKKADPAFNRWLEASGVKRPGDPTFSLASGLHNGVYAAANFSGPVLNLAVGKGFEATGLQEKFPYESGLAKAAIVGCLAVAPAVAIQFRKWVGEACYAPAAQNMVGYALTTPGEKAPLLDALLETCSDEEPLYGLAKQIAVCEPREASTPTAPPGQSIPAGSPFSLTPVPASLSASLAGPGVASPVFGRPAVVSAAPVVAPGRHEVIDVQKLAGTGQAGSTAGAVRTVRKPDRSVVVEVQPTLGPTVNGVHQVTVPIIPGTVTGWNPTATGTAMTVVPADGKGRVTAGTKVWTGQVRTQPGARLEFNGGGGPTAVAGFADIGVNHGDQTKEVWRIFAAQRFDSTGRTFSAQVPQGYTVDLAAADGSMIEIVVPAGTRPVTMSQRAAPLPSSIDFASSPALTQPAPATNPAPARTPSRPAVPLGPPVPAPAPQPNLLQQAGTAAWQFIDGPVTMWPVDGDKLTHDGMTQFGATFVGRNGASFYDATTGKKISGDGPATIPSWQRPIPPAMLLVPRRLPILGPAGGRLIPRLIPAVP